MRSKSLCAAACIVAIVALSPLFSANASRTSTEQILYSFTGGSGGGSPYSHLTLDAAGNLYGTTSGGDYTGGRYCAEYGGCGVVFELQRTQAGWTEKVLYSFQGGQDGGFPTSGVIFDNAGNLYGTTQGLYYGNATIFKLAPSPGGAWTETVLYSFSSGADFPFPQADLVFDASGNLYGTMGRLVFELIPQGNGSWDEVTIHQFNGAPDGSVPTSLAIDNLGQLYGMTQNGGTGKCYSYGPGCGILYKLASRAHGQWDETILYNFPRGGGYGVNPSGAFMLDAQRRYMLGSTLYGGDGLGTIFQLIDSPKGLTQNILYRFYGNPDGAFPIGKLATNSAGVMFGVTSEGGSGGLRAGAVFALERVHGNDFRERVIHSFGIASDGIYPKSGVVFDAQGNIYGTTEGGGTGCKNGCGTVYEITP